MDELVLEGAEETLGAGIVEAIALCATCWGLCHCLNSFVKCFRVSMAHLPGGSIVPLFGVHEPRLPST